MPARDLDTTIAGLALVAEYDDRDNIFTPTSGTRIQLQATDFHPRYGSDPTFRLYKAAANTYGNPHRDVVLGGRLDFRGSTGDTPFYAVPFIELRGIPYLRYQGERVAVAEVGGALEPRRPLVARGLRGRRAAPRSAGATWAPRRRAGRAAWAIRYLLARAMGLHGGHRRGARARGDGLGPDRRVGLALAPLRR